MTKSYYISSLQELGKKRYKKHRIHLKKLKWKNFHLECKKLNFRDRMVACIKKRFPDLTIISEELRQYIVELKSPYSPEELVDYSFAIQINVPSNYPETSCDLELSSIPYIESLPEVADMVVRRLFIEPLQENNMHNSNSWDAKDVRKIITWIELHLYTIAQIALEVDAKRQEIRDEETAHRQRAEEQNRIRQQREEELRKQQANSKRGKRKAKQRNAKAEKAEKSDQPHSERLAEKYTPSWDICYSFKKTGKCRAKNCKWRHHRPDK